LIQQIFEYLGENPLVFAATIAGVGVPFLYYILFGGKKPSVDVDGAPVQESAESEGTENKDEQAESEKKEESKASKESKKDK